MTTVKITRLQPHPDNPRVIKDANYQTLKASIQGFPQMMDKRPLVVVKKEGNKLMVLGGSQRLAACKELGWKDIQVEFADDWTEEQRREFMIKDNLHAGDWDNEILKSNWGAEQLEEWGVPILHTGDVDIDAFFAEDPNDEAKKHSIVLQYDADTHAKIVARLKQIGGKPEQVVLDLLNVA